MRRHLALAAVAPLALACESNTAPPADGGCIDAGANTVCGSPRQFAVAFAGLDFPMLTDAGVPMPNVVDVILADHDLSAACPGSDGGSLPTFTAVDIRINGYFLPVDAGIYTSPTAEAAEITWDDAGVTLLAESDETWVQIESVSNQVVVGYFTADMALPTSGTAPLWGDFSAQSCQGLHAAIGPPP
jgi:hypothetical protein